MSGLIKINTRRGQESLAEQVVTAIPNEPFISSRPKQGKIQVVPEPIRWNVQDRYSNSIYLTQERWDHIIESINHPEMEEYEEELKETVQSGVRKQDSLNTQKYRYSKEFDNLPADNTHVVAIVLFRLHESGLGEIESNNFIVTAYQKETG
jgi:hypothetical protein